MNEEQWEGLSSGVEERVQIECHPVSECFSHLKEKRMCSQFIVAPIMVLGHEMYDVFIEIPTVDPFKDQVENLHFKFAYINENFTDMQLAVRYTFATISFILMVWYFCKMKGIPRGIPATYDQRQLYLLMPALLFFNDPLYALNVFNPSYGLMGSSAFFTAFFFCSLLRFWLRSLHNMQDDPIR